MPLLRDIFVISTLPRTFIFKLPPQLSEWSKYVQFLTINANPCSSPPTLTTDETYKKNVTTQGLPVAVEDFDGFKLCWIGSRDAKQVIVHTCGGGLVMHAYDAHIITLINGYKVMKSNGQDVAIAILAYGVCPGAPYPTQIRQLVATVQHLLKTRAPETS